MIYVLLLEKDKWYIGYTDRKDGERFTEHFTGQGSKWTQLYKPVQVMEWREGTLADENKVTLEYMQKYGWWNVRGGSYCHVDMSEPPKQLIPALPPQLNTSDKQTKKIYKNSKWITIKPVNNTQEKKINNQKLTQIHQGTCFRCGKDGHSEKACYVKKDVNGNYINDKESESTDSSDSSDSNDSGKYHKTIRKSNNCYKCGRSGHYATDCYATTHKKGYYIDNYI